MLAVASEDLEAGQRIMRDGWAEGQDAEVLEIAEQPVDLEASSAQCPACGSDFAPSAGRCGSCGLRLG